MSKRLEGKVAVITGAASGIGRALAARCAGLAMNVVLVDVEARPLLRVLVGIEDCSGRSRSNRPLGCPGSKLRNLTPSGCFKSS